MRGNIPYEPSSRRRLSAWLQEKLFERRIVLVTGRLDAELAAEVAAALTTLDAIGDEPIELHLDSPDGTLYPGYRDLFPSPPPAGRRPLPAGLPRPGRRWR